RWGRYRLRLCDATAAGQGNDAHAGGHQPTDTLVKFHRAPSWSAAADGSALSRSMQAMPPSTATKAQRGHVSSEPRVHRMDSVVTTETRCCSPEVTEVANHPNHP